MRRESNKETADAESADHQQLKRRKVEEKLDDMPQTMIDSDGEQDGDNTGEKNSDPSAGEEKESKRSLVEEGKSSASARPNITYPSNSRSSSSSSGRDNQEQKAQENKRRRIGNLQGHRESEASTMWSKYSPALGSRRQAGDVVSAWVGQ